MVEAYPKHALNPSRQGPRRRPRLRKPKPQNTSSRDKQRVHKRSTYLVALCQCRRPCPARGFEGHPCPLVPSNPGIPKGSPSAREGGVTDEANLHPRRRPDSTSILPTPLLPSSTPVPGLAPLAHLGLSRACACGWLLVAGHWSGLSASQSARAHPPAGGYWRPAVTAPPSPAFHSLPSSRIQPTSKPAQGFISSHSLPPTPATPALLLHFSCTASPLLLLLLFLFTLTLKTHHHPRPNRTSSSTPGK